MAEHADGPSLPTCVLQFDRLIEQAGERAFVESGLVHRESVFVGRMLQLVSRTGESQRRVVHLGWTVSAYVRLVPVGDADYGSEAYSNVDVRHVDLDACVALFVSRVAEARQNLEYKREFDRQWAAKKALASTGGAA